jgi:hypothetical protein
MLAELRYAILLFLNDFNCYEKYKLKHLGKTYCY